MVKRANFAEAVKHGFTSYSPFKQQHNVKSNNEEDDNKKTRFGPPKVNLPDRELEDIVTQTHYRVTTANSNGTFASQFGA